MNDVSQSQVEEDVQISPDAKKQKKSLESKWRRGGGGGRGDLCSVVYRFSPHMWLLSFCKKAVHLAMLYLWVYGVVCRINIYCCACHKV